MKRTQDKQSDELRSVDVAIEWLVFDRLKDPRSFVTEDRFIMEYAPGDKVSPYLPAYSSNRGDAQAVIDRLKADGAKISFAPHGSGSTCNFVPVTEGWIPARITSDSEAMALCLCIHKAAREILTFWDKMPPGIAHLLE